MGNTTRQKLFLIAPEFKSTLLALINLVLEDVQRMVGSQYGNNQEVAQRYLAAHILTIISPEGHDVGTGVSKERLGDENVTYLKPDKWSEFNSTKYGILYLRYAKGSVPTAMFVTP